jgi:hypothetical protein
MKGVATRPAAWSVVAELTAVEPSALKLVVFPARYVLPSAATATPFAASEAGPPHVSCCWSVAARADPATTSIDNMANAPERAS